MELGSLDFFFFHGKVFNLALYFLFLFCLILKSVGGKEHQKLPSNPTNVLLLVL